MAKNLMPSVVLRTPNIRAFDEGQRSVGQYGSMLSLVNAQECGVRIAVAHSMLERTGVTDKVCLGFDDSGIYLGAYIANCKQYVVRKGSGNKKHIYAKGVVEQATRVWNLDFTDHTTHSFSEVEYLEIDGYTVAFVPISMGGSAAEEELTV